MRRYLAFCGMKYYPAGGWDDFVGHFDTVEDALIEILKHIDADLSWWHVVDTLTMTIAKRNK